jgi:hypothetical protein
MINFTLTTNKLLIKVSLSSILLKTLNTIQQDNRRHLIFLLKYKLTIEIMSPFLYCSYYYNLRLVHDKYCFFKFLNLCEFLNLIFI